jgi:hypothetical protein
MAHGAAQAAFLCLLNGESLASASVMANDFAAFL